MIALKRSLECVHDVSCTLYYYYFTFCLDTLVVIIIIIVCIPDVILLSCILSWQYVCVGLRMRISLKSICINWVYYWSTTFNYEGYRGTVVHAAPFSPRLPSRAQSKTTLGMQTYEVRVVIILCFGFFVPFISNCFSIWRVCYECRNAS